MRAYVTFERIPPQPEIRLYALIRAEIRLGDRRSGLRYTIQLDTRDFYGWMIPHVISDLCAGVRPHLVAEYDNPRTFCREKWVGQKRQGWTKADALDAIGHTFSGRRPFVPGHVEGEIEAIDPMWLRSNTPQSLAGQCFNHRGEYTL